MAEIAAYAQQLRQQRQAVYSIMPRRTLWRSARRRCTSVGRCTRIHADALSGPVAGKQSKQRALAWL